MYDYEWLGYGLVLKLGGGEVFLQGEEASELHDQLEACGTEAELEALLGEYEVLCEE